MASREVPGSSDDKKPKKSILKHNAEKHRSGIQWDEMNILMTHHPADKDYGHMKINEPLTPYNRYKDPDGEDEEGDTAGGKPVDPISDDEAESLDPKRLSKKMKDAPIRGDWEQAEDEDESEDKHQSPEQMAHRKEFNKHRKEHYNEAENIKLARALIAKELEELEDDGEPTSSTFAESAHSPSAEQQMDQT